MSETKICRDCRHYTGSWDGDCERPGLGKMDRVSGFVSYPQAAGERSEPLGGCGHAGRHFERRQPFIFRNSRGITLALLIAIAFILGVMACNKARAADPDFRLQLKANNAAELKLVDELEAAIDKSTGAVTAAKAETAKVQATADTLKAERDSNARIASKSIEREKKSAAFEARMYAWDGGGAIWWGLTRWALHIALAFGALAGVLTVLSIFFPPVGLILGTIGRNLLSLAVKRIAL